MAPNSRNADTHGVYRLLFEHPEYDLEIQRLPKTAIFSDFRAAMLVEWRGMSQTGLLYKERQYQCNFKRK